MEIQNSKFVFWIQNTQIQNTKIQIFPQTFFSTTNGQDLQAGIWNFGENSEKSKKIMSVKKHASEKPWKL